MKNQLITASLTAIRHMAVTASGAIVIAMQYQGPQQDRLPLVCRYEAGQLHLMSAPGEITAQMKNYCGSVAVDSGGQTACVTSPRGNISTFWSVADGAFLGSTRTEDGCGATTGPGAGGFLVSSGTGRLVTVGGHEDFDQSVSHHHNMAWDNHIIRSQA